MTILRVGTNEKYAEGWGRIFGTGTGKQKRTTKKAGSKPAGKKSTVAVKSAKKSATSAKKPAKKKAKK